MNQALILPLPEAVLFSCTIPGRSRILKNSKRLVRNRKTGRMFPIASDIYKRWEIYAAMFIRRAKTDPTIDYPVTVSMRFYFKDHAHEPDLSNLYQGVEDLLQKEGVITNDKLIYSHDGSRKVFGDKNERVEVVVTRFLPTP